MDVVDNTTDGSNGLPSISSELTINGDGSTVERDALAPDFRIFDVGGGGNLTLNDVTITGGAAIGIRPIDSGGGILNSGQLTITNSTLSGNSATSSSGGGIYDSGTVETKNTVIAGNTDTSGVGPDCVGTLSSLGYNLIGNDTGCTFSAITGDLVGTGGSPIDSMLGPLQDNGGPTETHELLLGSPAIDHIPEIDCVDGDGNPVAVDQRGVTRPQGANTPDGACDIEAYEREPVPVPPRLVFTIQPTDTPVGDVIAPPVVVEAQDALGDVDTTFNADVAIAIGNNPGGGTLSGTTVVSAVAGVVTFSDLSIDTAGLVTI